MLENNFVARNVYYDKCGIFSLESNMYPVRSIIKKKKGEILTLKHLPKKEST